MSFDDLLAQLTQPPRARAPAAPHEAQPATPACSGQSVSRAVALSLDSIDDLFTPHTVPALTPAAQQRPTPVFLSALPGSQPASHQSVAPYLHLGSQYLPALPGSQPASHQSVAPCLHLGSQSQLSWAAVLVQAEATKDVDAAAAAVGGEVERYTFGRWVGDDPPWAAIKEMVHLIKQTMGDLVDNKVLKQKEGDIASGDMRIIAVRVQNEMVAFAAYRLNDYEDSEHMAYLYELHVAEAYQGRTPSIGKALIDEVESKAALGISGILRLTVKVINKRALGFYTVKCGFKFVDLDASDKPMAVDDGNYRLQKQCRQHQGAQLASSAQASAPAASLTAVSSAPALAPAAAAPPAAVAVSRSAAVSLESMLMSSSSITASATAEPTAPALQLVWDEGDDESSDNDDDKTKIGGQLWGAEQFVCGYTQPSVWDLRNLTAAQEWCCPCTKTGQVSCLHASRMTVLHLYDHRTAFHKRAGKNLRDALRDDLASHYDACTSSFNKGFKVGPRADCCAVAYALACGMCFKTFARARADVTLDRPKQAERRQHKTSKHEAAAAQVRGYLASLKAKLEGSKGGTYAGGMTKYYTARKTDKRRYDDYCAQMNLDKVEVKCTTIKHFTELWKADKQIVEVSATGHSICDHCTAFDARAEALGSRMDAEASRLRRELDEDRREHFRVHDASRKVFDDATYQAEHRPDLVTMINIDAPTKRQFDLPRHPKNRDVPKGLEGEKRWESKVTGAMDASVGMRVFVAHESVKAGPNLVATVLYLTLLGHVKLGSPLGQNLLLQLDNTCGENKCLCILATVAWLVQSCSFDGALINCMPVGHTFTILDQSYNTLIDGMHQSTLPTVEAMLHEIQRRMREYNCVEVTELKAVFDFWEWFKPVIVKLTGFARREALGGLYTGMGQFQFNRDASGQVRLKMRVAPTATTWIPEGDGYLLFNVTSPLSGGPPLAPLKSFAEWQKETVVTNVRRWLPFLGIDLAAQQDAKAEWETRLASLTQSVREIELRGEAPVWEGPPKSPEPRNNTAGGASDGAARPWIGVVDNPPVNPIDVERGKQYTQSVTAWQKSTRAEAALSGVAPPVHLSDYLIVKDSSNLPCLIRVLGGTLGLGGGDILVYGTTYDQDPNPLVAVSSWGWGTFSPRRNGAYDPHDRSKGTVHVSTHDIKRSNVLVYDAKAFLDSREELRLHVDTLKALALSGEYPLPTPLPSTHLRCPAGAPASYVPPAKRTTGADAGTGSRDAGEGAGAGSGSGAGKGAGKRAGAPVATSAKRKSAGSGSVPEGSEVSGEVSGEVSSGEVSGTVSGAGAISGAVSGAGAIVPVTASAESEMYEVEALIGRKKSRGARYDHGFRKGTWIYLVKWEGYEEATWEDARNIENSLIEAYEDDHGSAHTSDFDSDADRDGQGGKTSPSGPLRAACSTRQKEKMKALHQEIFGSSGDSD